MIKSASTPLLVCGQMRSGTTLLANFLNAQADISVHRDRATVLFRNQHGIIHPLDYEKTISQDTVNLIQQELETNLATILNAKNLSDAQRTNLAEKYRICLQKAEQVNYKVLVEQCCAQMANPGDVYAGAKVTACEHNIGPFISQVKGKAIAIVRNPIHCVASISSVNFKGGAFKNKIEAYVQSWNRGADRLFEYACDDLLVIRFEDFINEKQSTCVRISNFLGIEIQAGIQHLSDYGCEWHGNSSFNKKLDAVDKSLMIRKSAIDEQSTELVAATCAENMRRLGYLR